MFLDDKIKNTTLKCLPEIHHYSNEVTLILMTALLSMSLHLNGGNYLNVCIPTSQITEYSSVMILTCKCMLLFNNQELAKLYNSIEMKRLGGHAGLGQFSKLLSMKMVFAYLCKVIEK